MKKVIFIAGTSYSGSTLLDMILANDPNGFSCGEVQALFYPWRPHHKNPKCGCGDQNCHVWEKVAKSGEEKLYDTIFTLFPRVNFIVVSSKDPFWISRQLQRLINSDIETKNVLIWKTPLELAHSFNKRGRLKDWERSWVNYHRVYFSLFHEFRPIRYSHLINDKDILLELCGYLEIPYFPDKTKYWLKKHHTLFGNISAKIHLYPKRSDSFHNTKNELMHVFSKNLSLRLDTHRTIYYEHIENNVLADFVHSKLKSNEYFGKILEVLSNYNQKDLPEYKDTIHELSLPRYSLFLRKTRRTFDSIKFRLTTSIFRL